jgi:hypothetical protein
MKSTRDIQPLTRTLILIGLAWGHSSAIASEFEIKAFDPELDNLTVTSPARVQRARHFSAGRRSVSPKPSRQAGAGLRHSTQSDAIEARQAAPLEVLPAIVPEEKN